MDFRKRLEQQATRLGENARRAATSEPGQKAGSSVRRAIASAPMQQTGERFRGFRSMLADDDQTISIETYLLTLVRAVRNDERDEEQTKRDVYVRARKRRRRLGLASFRAGPFAGVASRVADLYCEAATVCDVADFHELNLDDAQIAAHLLVLWSIADDLGQAENAMRARPSVAELLGAKLLDRSGVTLPETLSKPAIAKVLWEFHQLDLRNTVTTARNSASGQPIRSVAFTGHRTKKVIKKVEKQFAGSPR